MMSLRPETSSFRSAGTAALALTFLLIAGCASVRAPYETRRDKTAKGAGIGAAAGAAAAILDGKREADDVLAGALIGAAIGGGVGAYMDAQEERFARIPGTDVERVGPNTLLIHFRSDVLFAIDSARLDSASRAALGQAAVVMQDFPKTAIIVQGHTDATGSEAHNQALSERRAKAVRGFLINRGVAPARIVAIGYGEGSPRASNDSEYGRRLNRRVDLLLRAKAR